MKKRSGRTEEKISRDAAYPRKCSGGGERAERDIFLHGFNWTVYWEVRLVMERLKAEERVEMLYLKVLIFIDNYHFHTL